MTDEVLPEPAGVDEPERPGRLSRLRGIAVDTTPLRESRDFRRLFFGDSVSTIGTQMTAVAVPIQVYDLTHSSFAVGLASVATLVPLVVFGLVGGAIADAVDRRRLLLTSSSLLACVSALLFAQAALDLRRVWLLYVLVFFQAALFAIDSPARRAIIPRLLPARQIPAAAALSWVTFGFATIVGPLVAGVLIGVFGLQSAYAVDVLSFGAALAAAASIRAVPPEGGGTKAGFASIVDGLRFLRARPVLMTAFAVDINAMVFGMPRALFPSLAENRFHGGPGSTGLLYAAPAFGVLFGSLLGGWFGKVRRQGFAVLVSVAVWGVAIVGFGLSPAMWLAVLMLAIAGGADTVSAVFRTAIQQVATPDEMRGRLSGVFIAVVAGGPRLGDFEAGAVAALTSAEFSVVSGGVLCVLGVLALGLGVPSFARYEAPPED